MEAGLCDGEEVVVVGGGNSAGQAAVFLSNHTRHVHMLIRSENLAATMSDYLIQRIDASNRITLHRNTEIVSLAGIFELESMTWCDRATGRETKHGIKHLFLMLGAVPNSAFLGDCVLMDERGFVCTVKTLPARSVGNSNAFLTPSNQASLISSLLAMSEREASNALRQRLVKAAFAFNLYTGRRQTCSRN
ncbi:MAG: NAD(P)-binding domain-containing protein [Planctomycetota bacterium]